MKTPNLKLEQWHKFQAANPKVEFVWLQVLSYSSRPYVRIVPTDKFTEILQNRRYVSMPTASFSFDPEDHPVRGSSSCGTFYLWPDLDSIYCQPGSEGTRAVVQCSCVDEGDTPIKECARSRLQALVDLVQREKGLTALVGFEVEVVFMKAETHEDGTTAEYYPRSDVHNWSCVTLEDTKFLRALESIARSLADVGLLLEQFHAESAPAQWEFGLPPAPPVQAIDMLLRARETIRTVAFSHGLHATLYPRPSPDHPGTGARVHLSLNSPSGERLASSRVEPFFAGLVNHMPSILAFALPMEQSYDRLKTGNWSGMEYACWGWANEKTPLRRVKGNRFEFKLMDGLANPFLTLAAIFAAGLEGLRTGTALQAGPCPQATADLTSNELYKLGVNICLPQTLGESLKALEADAALCSALSKQAVTTYVGPKRGEAKWFRRMEPEKQVAWFVSRY